MSKLKLSAGLKGIRLGPQVSGATPALPPDSQEMAASTPALRLPIGNIKEVQRLAFQRGREAALEEVQDVVLSAVAELRSTVADLQSSRESERARLSEFAIKLSCCIAEKLTARVISAGEHNVQELVNRILQELYPDGVAARVALRGHPLDIDALRDYVAQDGNPDLQLVPDGSVAKASFHVEAEGVIFDSCIVERLDAIRERLIQEESCDHSS